MLKKLENLQIDLLKFVDQLLQVNDTEVYGKIELPFYLLKAEEVGRFRRSYDRTSNPEYYHKHVEEEYQLILAKWKKDSEWLGDFTKRKQMQKKIL